MLTAAQIDAVRDASEQLLDPVIDYLVEDIARRVKEAGQLTGTASYEVWRAQKLGVSQKQLKKKLQEKLKKSAADLEKLLKQTAKTGYNFDLSRFPTNRGIPFAANSSIQQIVAAAVQQAQDGLNNITRTMGFVGADGQARELTDAYRKACDDVYMRTVTGAQDYTSAIRDATRGLAERGILSLDYQSGRHYTVEAAVRQNIMGGLGLMQEQISQQNHDDLGCDGWEISAHGGSAPDHEPIQGKQYTDKQYKRINDHLLRRIGTLNCGHAAFPIIMGVNAPQYTAAELEELRQQNEAGVTVDGRHYTLYEATQRQRKLERSMRNQKRKILIDKTLEDEEKLQIDQIKLVRLRDEYARFSKEAGLPTQHARAEAAGFTWKDAKAAESAAKKSIAKQKETDILTIGNVVAEHQINSPIESRNTAKGKPGAIMHFGVPLNKRQQAVLDRLPDYDSRVIVKKSNVSMKDLSALTAETGVEFAMFTKGAERLIVRGDRVSVGIGADEAVALAKAGYRWSGHTHPGSGLNSLLASGGDIQVLGCFSQSQSVIYNSTGDYLVFGKE